jgi:uncharacterized protein (TIRG00374 family)
MSAESTLDPPNTVQEAAPQTRGRKALATALKVSLGLAFSALFIYLAARDADWGTLRAQASRIQWFWVAASAAVTTLMVAVRFVRWGVALRVFGNVSWRRTFGVGALGAMATFVLPVRLGEFVRPVFIARGESIKVSEGMATIVVERLVDGLSATAMILIIVLVLDPTEVPEQFIFSGYFAAALFGGLSVGVLVAGLLFPLLKGPIRATVGRVSARISDKLIAAMASFFGALKLLSKPRVGLSYIALTVVTWTISGLAMAVLFRAFPGAVAELPLVAAFAALGVLVVGISLPAGPAMAGTFHWGVVFGLTMFGVDPSSAFLYAAVLHLMQALLNVTFGSAGWLFGDVAGKGP